LFDLTGLKHGHEHHSGFEAKNDWLTDWLTDILTDKGGEEEIPSPRRESNPRTPIVQPVGQLTDSLSDRLPDWLTDRQL
jgi:hypothetical protein